MEDPFFIRAEDKFYEKTVGPRIVRVIKHQTGKTNVQVDKYIKAMRPGKRISKTGKIYWETRASRSDIDPKKRL